MDELHQSQADDIDPPYQGEKHLVFLTTLAVARMVIWEMRYKGLYDGTKFSHCDLILFFRHQLRVKYDVIENAWTA